MENFRRAIGIKIKEVKEVFEGQVVEIVSISFLAARHSENELPALTKRSCTNFQQGANQILSRVAIQMDEPTDGMNAESCTVSDPPEGSSIPPVRLTLKTAKNSKTLRLHASINQGLLGFFQTILGIHTRVRS